MLQIRRSREAGNDLRDIALYIAAENPTAACDWLDEMERLFRTLATQPDMGERIRTRRIGIVRRTSLGNYLDYFRTFSGAMEVLRVIHGARNQDRLV